MSVRKYKHPIKVRSRQAKNGFYIGLFEGRYAQAKNLNYYIGIGSDCADASLGEWLTIGEARKLLHDLTYYLQLVEKIKCQ